MARLFSWPPVATDTEWVAAALRTVAVMCMVRLPLFVVAAEHAAQQAARAETAQHGAFFARAAALRRRGEHARGQARERQALQPHRPGASEPGEEQALAAEQGG